MHKSFFSVKSVETGEGWPEIVFRYAFELAFTKRNVTDPTPLNDMQPHVIMNPLPY